jgi:sigma-E factor negative regulatory protein RseC
VIEEHARVVALGDEDVWVETQRRSACGQCAAGHSCGTAVLGKVLGNKRSRVRILNPSATVLSVGDEVVIGIEEKAMIRGSFHLYALPLLSFFLFAALGQVLTQQLLLGHSEAMTIGFGMLGLGVGFAWVKHFSRAISDDAHYQPVLLRRVLPLVRQQVSL